MRQLLKPNAIHDLKNLQPTFIKESITVSFWAGFTYGCHTPVVPMRKRTEAHRNSDRDPLGFISHQYVRQKLIPHVCPLCKKAGGAEAGVQTIEDSAIYPTSTYSEIYRKHCGLEWMDWPSHLPDFNRIENVSLLFTTDYRKAVWEKQRIPHSTKELIRLE